MVVENNDNTGGLGARLRGESRAMAKQGGRTSNLKYLKGRELGSVYLWVFQHTRYLFENMIVGADNNVLRFRGSSSGRTLRGDASLRGSHCTQQCR
jgi:hypothetical protein